MASKKQNYSVYAYVSKSGESWNADVRLTEEEANGLRLRFETLTEQKLLGDWSLFQVPASPYTLSDVEEFLEDELELSTLESGDCKCTDDPCTHGPKL